MILVPCLSLADATAHYRVTLPGGATGTARLTQTRQADGGKAVHLLVELRRGNVTLAVRSDSTFDAKGAPVRVLQSFGPMGGRPQHEVIVTFDAQGANAVVRDQGVPKTVHIALAPKLNRSNAAQTWFVARKPAVGEVAKAWTFDPDALEWVYTETTYVGRGKGGQLLRLTRRERRSDVVVDDGGLPIRLDDGGMVLVRV